MEADKPGKVRLLELLSPARDAETAIAAIAHGADAVYIGGPAFGARSAAGNSVADISRVVTAARPFGVRVYVTLNTILFDNELSAARDVIHQLWHEGVDALIIQDPAILAMDIPPIELHASTQWNSDTVARIEMLSRAGFSTVVVPREFSLDLITEAARAVGDRVRLEAFVHGALCVSYSGGCYAGQALAGRSANRGCCPQICRLPFTLTDSNGCAVVMPDGAQAMRHWLSLADMNRLDSLGAMADAGVSSFKIEGRLKPVAYVKNVTAAYSAALDKVVSASGGRYSRASFGRAVTNFRPDPARSFNRGFTHYFLRPGDDRGMSSWATPKWIGLPVGEVKAVGCRKLSVDVSVPLHNGDGLGWFDRRGAFHGFRVNRVDGNTIFPAPGSDTPCDSGVKLYRNSDSEFESMMGRTDTARRVIDVNMELRRVSDGRVALEAADCRGCRVIVTTDAPCTDTARTSQTEARRSNLSRLGDTIYNMCSLDDSLGDMFIPASVLTALRRKAVGALDKVWNMRYRRGTRRPAELADDEFAGYLDYTANVANSAARDFYLSHGAVAVDDALEVSAPVGEVRVMTTRYCLRRELGACLKTRSASALPDGLWLDAPAGRLRLGFDCANCRMLVYAKKRNIKSNTDKCE